MFGARIISTPAAIERYALYGEPVREAELRFMHVERISKRSGAHQWSIKPHAHAGLHQILLLTSGGGSMQVEADLLRFTAPTLIIVPAGLVHGFEFSPLTDGLVATVAESFVTDASRGDAAVAGVLASVLCVDSIAAELTAHAIPDAFEALAAEFTWSAPSRMLMIEAHIVRILVGAGRIAMERRPLRWRNPSGDGALVERFRQEIERNFRDRVPLAAYAQALGVTESRLSAACRRAFGEPAVKLVQRRRLVEAQRYLLYTSHSVSEIGYFLGFQDPSYFSRFFIKLTGETPSDYRSQRLIIP
ncbi:AraC family transcriptional activator of pobA [Azospirillum agricola]|uniref:helix-turn-helix domain-containing protein n=1 Tax=Azospirillum agricola TaxID=1720247 RepID=UPI001AE76D0B|nr:helix-turn-helix domain-containing protein [Azospirillum agricola]MBP2232573.1 AraC family transcriptional activator of pobA [Azospirillum agricola]